MSNYKMRNQSIMEEISENLKKTIKKWNEVDIVDDNIKDNNRKCNNKILAEESEDRLKRKNMNLKGVKQEHEYEGDKEFFNTIDYICGQSDKENLGRKNKSEDDSKKDKIRHQAESSYNQFQYNGRIHQNQVANQNFSDYSNALKFFQQSNKTENYQNTNLIAQSNKILQNLENFDEEINKDFKDMEEMIESVERELKILSK